MQVAYFDCASGISGDMILGALIDCGLKRGVLESELKKLKLKGISIRSRRVMRHGVPAVKFDVIIDDSCKAKGFHKLSEIIKLIDASGLSETVKANSKKAFELLAEAEASAHRKKKSAIHLHEVGMLDSVVDVVGSMIAYYELGIDEAYSSPIPLGRGFVDTAHGRIPIPAPATTYLVRGLPVIFNDIEAELATPTGVAILKTLAKRFGSDVSFDVIHTGVGAGERDLEAQPNIMRVMLGKRTASLGDSDEILVLETNIDDMRPLYIERLFERLKERGALDFWVEHIQMKKNRPAFKISVIIKEESLGRIVKTIFEETTSFGIRYYKARRRKLIKRTNVLNTKYGRVRVNEGTLNGKNLISSVEYEDCLRIARRKGVPLRKIYEGVEGLVRSNGAG